MSTVKKSYGLIVILILAAILRFYNLMHDSPYFFNPDERNMAIAITRFRLPAKFSEIPICLISQISPIFTEHRPPTTDHCNLNPHFFAYGQFPLYLAFVSDQIIRAPLAVLQGVPLPLQDSLQTSFPSAIFWLRFWSALSSVFTVLLVYLITKALFTCHSGNPPAGGASRISMRSRSCQDDNKGIYFGLIAALCAPFTPGLIQSAHFGTTESFLTFFFLTSIYLSIKLLDNPFRFPFPKYLILNTKYIILLSFTIGLSLGSKLTGIFFFVPPFIILVIQYIRIIKKQKKSWQFVTLFHCFIVSLLTIGSIFFFVLSSPYNLVEPEDFRSAVFGYEADVASGKYEAFYTRQFVDTTPILFQMEKIFPYTLGWPVFIMGTIGLLFIIINILHQGFLLTLHSIKYYLLGIRHKKKKKIYILNTRYLILTTSCLVYFLPNSFLFAKLTRFMTPILPFFSIFTAYFLYQILKLFWCHSDPPSGGEESLAARNLKRVERSLDSFQSLRMTKLAYWLIGLLVFISLLPGAAFMSLYTHEDSRVTASKWIYQNIPDNTYVLSETANVVDIPLGFQNNLNTTTKNYTVISFDFYHLDENRSLFNELLNHLEKADYSFIPSRRIFKNYPLLSEKYPLVTKYYQLLFSGRLGFEKVAEISSFPQLPISQIGPMGLIWDDENAEETFTVFDHPVVRIYQKVKPMTKEEYKFLFTSAAL